MGGTGRIWRPIAAALEEVRICLAPDQRGHGKSRPVPSEESGCFHAMDYAKDLLHILDLLDLEGYPRVHLVGHSMGVRTALALTALAPERVAGLLALDIGISSAWGGGIGVPLSQFLQGLPKHFPDRQEMRRTLLATCPDPAIAQYLSAVAEPAPGPDGGWVFPFDHEALIRTIDQAHHAPIGDWLEAALHRGIPCTFLRGAHSRVWLKPDYEDQRSRYVHPLLRFEEWENCGHGLPFEQRERLVRYLKENY